MKHSFVTLERACMVDELRAMGESRKLACERVGMPVSTYASISVFLKKNPGYREKAKYFRIMRDAR